ncbi:unnamed protein product [Cylindrotheca closterium]|uniref:Calmodulin n=1 Tax=Cylindrotheca closterium TaxID=2856 RepID=A0AAD2G865_9STRA|nr:unnamed protein product [Cylindrotheca closterium]
MKKRFLHLLFLVTPSVTCFQARFCFNSRGVESPHQLSSQLSSSSASSSASSLHSNKGYGNSYLDSLGSERNPNPVFPTTPSTTTRSDGINQGMSQSHPREEKDPVSSASAPAASSTWGPSQHQTPAEALLDTADSASLPTSDDIDIDGFQVSSNGMYQIQTEEEYRKLITAFPNKLIVVKFFATFCRSCKSLAPKMLAVMKDDQLEGLPILWAEFSAHRRNKDCFKRLGVITIPTVHIYDGDRGLVENFPCPPSKVSLLKKKLARIINTRVDPNTRQLLLPEAAIDGEEASLEPRVERTIMNNELISTEHLDFLRNDLPFFQDLTDDEFDTMMQQARLLTFDAGDVIMRQGMPGTCFYVIKSGSIEMSIKSRFDDPISTPPTYLGGVVSTLRKFDYFGERALTTGEPFAASFRSLDKVRCFAFHVDIIPPSSILSRKREATQQTIDMLSQRYVLPEDYKSPNFYSTKRDEGILDLLVRFKQIRQAARCLDYVMQNGVNWGDSGSIARRTMLVRKLTYAQQNEYNDIFNIVDVGRRGRIKLQQIREFLANATKEFKNGLGGQEAADLVAQQQANQYFPDGDILIAREEFMGVMAEAEFYNLFKETFQELDHENTGYVRAGDLDQILGGVRDLIGDKRHTSIVDVDDKDMLVDYEQFSRMLLGAAI